MSRERGVVGRTITAKEATGPEGRYALFRRADGRMVMICPEGVGYEVTDEKPWRWNDYTACEEFSPHDLARLAHFGEEVDLADWIRVFGARLESNFAVNRRWLTRD